ncbi:hypothetical protein [Streptomyces sp. NPDC060131]|uniref:hypothetical protein n=1 Tax=unclassified Streptomyces TaxID=2593676 RepID=UPI0036561F89
MSVLLTPPGPELRLLVSLAAWTWPGTRPDGGEIAHILITHTPALTGWGTTETAEAAKIDAYLDAALAADRLLFGRARTR